MSSLSKILEPVPKKMGIRIGIESPIPFSHEPTVGRPRITPSVKCLAPDAFSGAKLQVLMENGQKNEIDQGLGAPDLI